MTHVGVGERNEGRPGDLLDREYRLDEPSNTDSADTQPHSGSPAEDRVGQNHLTRNLQQHSAVT